MPAPRSKYSSDYICLGPKEVIENNICLSEFSLCNKRYRTITQSCVGALVGISNVP